MKAALYLRISQDHAGKSLGVTRQQEDCAELAAALGWDVAEVYVDNDTSATSGKPRPDYRRMLTDIDAGDIEAIVAWHPDRLYRVVPDLGPLIEVCKRNNIQIATVKAGNIDLTTPSGRLVAGLLAQVATYEGEAKADRWRRSVRQRREAGDWPGSGRRMFGWTVDGEVIEAEAELIQWLADEVIAGRTLTGLCRELEERGAVTVMGKPWQARSIRQLLTNARLAGFSTLSREVAVPGKIDKYGRPVKRRVVDIIGDGTWTPILDRDTWETARAILNGRKRQPAAPRVALLVGLVFCGKCGERMVTGGRGSKTNGNLRTYRCQKIPGRIDGCGGVSIAAEGVEELVESYARTRLADPRVRRALERMRAVAPGVDAHEVAQLETRLAELEQQLDEPGIPVASILRAIERVQERQAELSARVSSSAVVALPVGDSWPPDLTRRRALVDLVVERVSIKPAAIAGKFDPRRIKIDPK